MAKEKKLVQAITSMDEDFAQWYTDVIPPWARSLKMVMCAIAARKTTGRHVPLLT